MKNTVGYAPFRENVDEFAGSELRPQLAHGKSAIPGRRGPQNAELPSGELRCKMNRLLLARLRCEGP
jgi:hypothetical protein